MADLLPDRLQSSLGSAYTLKRELGGGGMARVFVAEDEALARRVVVKVLAPELAEGLSVERFTREIRLAAALQEPHIVPVLTAGVTADGLPYYTMPYVRGESLRARLASGSLPLREAVAILRDVAKALAYAHAQGVVHRDIKPENVLLHEGTAVVTDFGIAKALSASRTLAPAGENVIPAAATLTQAGTALGTPAYMAPEQAAGDPDTDHRADLYAWGLMAWELLAGAHPFAAHTTVHALISAQLTETPPSLSSRRLELPATLDRLVARCLAKDPAQRPASAEELVRELDTVTTPRELLAPRAIVTRGRKALVVALVVVLVAGSGATWWMRRGGQHIESLAPVEQSLAVLPFTALGGDTANAYFAEGIADELSTSLSRLPGLRLAGRASAASVKKRGASAQEIGDALRVGAVLDGTVRRAGERMRVSVELTSASTGAVLWKDSYEREVKDVFAVQDEITRAITDTLRVRFAGRAGPAAGSHGTANLAAYDLYLRALQHYRQRGPALALAERELTQAIALDPRFARAHALLASVLMVTPYYADRSMAQVMPTARAAAERAVAIDDALPEAHAALGYVNAEAFDWPAAEAELRRAIALDPNSAESAFRLGFMLMMSGRVRESVAALEQAKSNDPLYAMPSVYLAWAYAQTGRKAEAVPEARRALEIDPANEAVGNIYTATLLEAGLDAEALAFARQASPRATTRHRQAFFGWVMAGAGARDEALAILHRVEALPVRAWRRSSSLVHLYAALGDTARALDALEQAAASDGDLLLAQPMTHRRYDSIRSSARFAAAMRRYHLDIARVTAPGGQSR
jgi:TolB-like protein/tRNA A-37 threonylcarbamoyl transferase component Bud32/Tfp pilus assembly protein PilF